MVLSSFDGTSCQVPRSGNLLFYVSNIRQKKFRSIRKIGEVN